MSIVNQELLSSIYEPNEGLPQEIRAACVQEMILTLRNVTSAKSTEAYTVLPVLLETNVELAHTLTDAYPDGEAYTENGERVVYHWGRYHGEAVEFAAKYDKPESGGSLIAWGVRRYQLDGNHRAAALRLSPTMLDTFVHDVLGDFQDFDKRWAELELSRTA